MPVTLPQLKAMKHQTRQVWATAYDAWMASILDGRVDGILVGDSLGNVVQGLSNTLPVTLDEVIYHTKMVRRGVKESFLAADLPFLSYQESPSLAMHSAGRLLKEGGAQAVKLEGGREMAETIHFLVQRGIPVMGHLGMKPQFVHVYGGFGKQAKEQAAAQQLMAEMEVLTQAGCFAIVLENIPHELAQRATQENPQVLTIGIGAGGDTDGQIQVFHDLFGLFEDFTPRHAVPFGQVGKEMKSLALAYAQAVRDKQLVSK